MSLKKFLLLPLLISLLIFIHYSKAVSDSFQVLAHNIHISAGLILVVLVAAGLQIAGHIVRARKAELLFEPVKANTTRFQFRALSVGYLFNTLLPFRLGELIRARIIAGGLEISFSFALVLVIFERAVDAVILGGLGLIVLGFAGALRASLVGYITVLFAAAAIIFSAIMVAASGNIKILRWFYRFSGIFRGTIRNSLRFKAWSVIYGLQQCLRPVQLARYIVLSLLSWVFYMASLAVLVECLFRHLSVAHRLLLSLAPYYGVSVPSGPANLGVFSRITNAFAKSLHLNYTNSLTYNLLAWAVLIIPIAVLGLGLLFTKTKETLWRRAPRQASSLSLDNKLRRQEDISQEMAKFLENYFSGNSLSRIVHQLELSQDFRLLRYFKGGSDAITILAKQNGQEIVKKIIPLEFEDRLKAQYEWLERRKGREGIVTVLCEGRGANYYAIDLEYRPDDVMFFDFLHQNPVTKSQAILDEVWRYLSEDVHGKPGKLELHAKERDAYVKKHIFGCIEKAAQVHTDLLRATEPAKLQINGHEYDNLYQIMEKIKNHPQAWKDIATYKATKAVHGDVAVDNILVSQGTGHALLIDPAPDGNIIDGPVFDFGKNMQSLYCGYEFLLRDEAPVHLVEGTTINYAENMSNQFTKLCQYVRDDLAPKRLSQAEQKSIIFHAGALHIRRLKHQVYYNPANTLKFYAAGVKALNDFLAQYEPRL